MVKLVVLVIGFALFSFWIANGNGLVVVENLVNSLPAVEAHNEAYEWTMEQQALSESTK